MGTEEDTGKTMNGVLRPLGDTETNMTAHAMRRQKIFFRIALAILSALVLGSSIRIGNCGAERYSFNGMLDGTAWKPFVYHIFAPSLIRCITSILPHVIEDRLDGYSVLTGIRLTKVSAAVLVLHLSVLGFAWTFMRLARTLYGVQDLFLYAAILATIAGLPVLFKNRLSLEALGT